MYTIAMFEIQCSVSGRVQNVAYRAYVQDSATTLGISGWVRNEPNGTVAVVAQADRDTLKDFIEYLHEGSLRAVVESVAVEWTSPDARFDDFSIYHD